MGRGGVALLAVAALLAAAGAAILLLPGKPLPPPPALEPEPPPPPPPKPPPEPPPPPPPAVEAVVEETEEDDEWKQYPLNGKGPVVVGVVTKYGDPDPECWVALESADDPARPDPSAVETLEDGRFRMTGMAPGRYRVRVKEDDSLPTYSGVLEVRDGAVTDAGRLHLRRRGWISGSLRDGTGAEVSGEVRLFGRDPATLERKVVDSAPCIGPQGFQVLAHEAGEFSLAATGDAGFALHRGKTDGDGQATADLRLRPWAALDADLAPGTAEVRAVRIVLETVEAPDLGIPAPGGNKGAPARFERLPPGKYRVRAKWEEKAGAEWKPREGVLEAALAEGEAGRAAVPR